MGAGTQTAAVTSLSHHRDSSSWANDKVNLSEINARFNPLSVSLEKITDRNIIQYTGVGLGHVHNFLFIFFYSSLRHFAFFCLWIE